MMDNAAVRRITLGFSANLYGQAVVVVVQLVGVPVLLHAWGTHLYGEWLILFAIPAYLSMTDLGFSQSAANDMTQKMARGDQVGARRVYQSLLALVFSVAGVGVLVVSALVLGLPIDHWFQSDEMTGPAVRWVLWFFAAEVLVKLTEGASHAGYRSTGDYAFHVALTNTTMLLQFVSVWITALAGLGPTAAAACFFAVKVMGTGAAAIFLVRRHPLLEFSVAEARTVELRRLFHPAIANLGLPLAFALRVQGLVLVVGAVLGPLAVVVFSTLRTLTNMAFQMVLSASHAVEPEFATAYGSGDRGALRSLYVQTLRISLWMILPALAILALAGNWILQFWTRGRVTMDPQLFGWLLAAAGAGVLWYVGLTVLKAANRHLKAVGVFVASAAVTLVLAWLFMGANKHLASAGAALLITDAAMAAYVLWNSVGLCAINVRQLLGEAVNPFPILHMVWSRIHAR